jgi:anthranilate phosphoribosyltransferase
MRSLISKLNNGFDLARGEIDFAVAQLLADDIDAPSKVAFLDALHRKGETAEEVIGFTQALMKGAVDPGIDPATLPGPMIDVGGTGGGALGRFNVAPAVMFVLAAGGAVVVKHASRSGTARTSTEDVLTELRVPIRLSFDQLSESLKRLGLGFVSAADYHPAFRAMVDLRRPLAADNVTSVLNLIGPLLNPARPRRQLVGVFAPRLLPVLAEVLRGLGRDRAWVVHGLADSEEGLDDISICGATTIADLDGSKINSAVLDVAWIGIPRATLEDLRGGDAREDAKTVEGILSGQITGAKRDMVIANAAAGFVVAGRARELNAGISLAHEQIESGRAYEKLRAAQDSLSPGRR